MELTFTLPELVSLKGGGASSPVHLKRTVVRLLSATISNALKKETQATCDVSVSDISWVTTAMSRFLRGCTFELERGADAIPFTIIWHGVLEGEPEPSEEEISFTRLELKTMVVSQEKPTTCVKVIIVSFITGVIETAVRGESRYTDIVPEPELGIIIVQLMQVSTVQDRIHPET